VSTSQNKICLVKTLEENKKSCIKCLRNKEAEPCVGRECPFPQTGPVHASGRTREHLLVPLFTTLHLQTPFAQHITLTSSHRQNQSFIYACIFHSFFSIINLLPKPKPSFQQWLPVTKNSPLSNKKHSLARNTS